MRERLAATASALIQIAETPLMDAQENLERLMALYQEGDLGAATALIHSMSPRLYRFFAAQAVSRVEADDLLQETWLRIHKVRHTYRPGESVVAWFYAIARHVRVDHYRRVVRTTIRERELGEIARTAGVAPGRSDELEALLAPLSFGEREVVEMLKVEGLSLEEVARATSSTVGSVKQKAHRAYRKLRETFGLSRKKTEAPR
ncbi:MAG TPA: RNA polymerase sigma factor [Terracidiphilus sp.]|nr:RNA polymerase sigma factor [Terracidiphilus sp.]